RVMQTLETYSFFFFSSRRRHTRFSRDWSSDVCSSDLAHEKADLKNWRGNLKNSGFLPEEREWLSRVLDPDEGGYVDVVRALHPEVDGPYSWWSYRGRAFDNDTGWRIDYQMATPGLAARALKGYVERAAPH